ncbi:MAG: hypothetical protein K2K52_09175 [Paramuribaculum sp.]|nr:hypothetical protein [Paramuribaculum sp.]
MISEQQNFERLRQAVELIFGHKPNSPSDFDSLAARIQAATGMNLGVSTLKRFWGYVKSPHTPTYTTLSVLARYAGHRDWNTFCNNIQSEDESGFSKSSVIICSEDKIGSSYIIKWNGSKWCEIKKYAEPNLYEVIESRNIKLKKGDFIRLNSLTVGDFFVALECLRGTTQLGTYIGAKRHGISEIIRNN